MVSDLACLPRALLDRFLSHEMKILALRTCSPRPVSIVIYRACYLSLSNRHFEMKISSFGIASRVRRFQMNLPLHLESTGVGRVTGAEGLLGVWKRKGNQLTPV